MPDSRLDPFPFAMGARGMRSRLLRYRPPRIAMAVLAAAVAWQLLVPLPAVEVFRSAYLAAALLAGGFGVMIRAWWQFKQNAVAICPTQETALLITNGIYRLSRNPMYLGIVAMMLGVAAFAGTLPFYLAALVYFIIIDLAFCPYEEDKLERSFGNQYQAYRSRVRRWL